MGLVGTACRRLQSLDEACCGTELDMFQRHTVSWSSFTTSACGQTALPAWEHCCRERC